MGCENANKIDNCRCLKIINTFISLQATILDDMS